MSAHRKKPKAGRKTPRPVNHARRRDLFGRAGRSVGRKSRMKALVAAQEGERKRVSRELHDNIGQQVTAVLLGLKRLDAPLRKHADARAALQALQQIAERIGHDVHQLALELLPASLGDLGIVRCLATMIESRMARDRVVIELDSAEFRAPQLPEELEVALYRIVCGALDTAIQQAKASQVSIFMRCRAGRILVLVEDNGSGLDRRARKRHPHFAGIAERVDLMDGDIQVESDPGKGTTVVIILPLPPTPPRSDA